MLRNDSLKGPKLEAGEQLPGYVLLSDIRRQYIAGEISAEEVIALSSEHHRKVRDSAEPPF